MDNLYAEKQKLDKEKSKKGGKGKSKASLRLEEDNVRQTTTKRLRNWIDYHLCTSISILQANIKEYGQYESYDYDDFMWEPIDTDQPSMCDACAYQHHPIQYRDQLAIKSNLCHNSFLLNGKHNGKINFCYYYVSFHIFYYKNNNSLYKILIPHTDTRTLHPHIMVFYAVLCSFLFPKFRFDYEFDSRFLLPLFSLLLLFQLLCGFSLNRQCYLYKKKWKWKSRYSSNMKAIKSDQRRQRNGSTSKCTRNNFNI